MIPIGRQSANRTIVPPLGEIFGNDCPTYASLRSSARIHWNKDSTGAFSLVRDLENKRTPCGIVYGLGQHPCTQSLEIKILKGNQSMLVNQIARDLVVKVIPLISNVGVRSLQFYNGLPAPVAALPPSRYFPLRTTQFGLRLPVVFRVIDHGSVRQNQKVCQAHIDPYGFARIRKRAGVSLCTKAGVPSVGFPLDCDRLDNPIQRAVKFYLYLSRPLNVQSSGFEQAATVSVRRKSYRVPPCTRFKSGVSSFLSTLYTGKECFERLVHAAQNILATAEVHQSNKSFFFYCFQLVSLIVVADRFSAGFPCIPSLLESAVIQIARLAKLPFEEGVLRFSWVHTVFESDSHQDVFSFFANCRRANSKTEALLIPSLSERFAKILCASALRRKLVGCLAVTMKSIVAHIELHCKEAYA